YAFDEAEFDLSAAAADADSGYVIDGHDDARVETVR
ncbi:MAG: hypothetical protein FD152_2909, partial [Xanthobacteraceae bacterium]